MSDKGWSCPKCGRVFAPFVQDCKPCNSRIDNQEGAKATPERKLVAKDFDPTGESREEVKASPLRLERHKQETRAQFEDRHKDDPLRGYGGHYGY